tara:strand:- start:387 stop:1016 length:630 start_codon:yes stop_codon:yes gene_type:complete
MSDSSELIDTKVFELSTYLGCEPQMAQELYFEHEVVLSLDGAQRASMRRELEGLTAVKDDLARALNELDGIKEYDNHLRLALEINGVHIKSQISILLKELEGTLDHAEMSWKKETSGTRANKKADKVAEYVAAIFIATGRNVGFGVYPNDKDEPSTPYGRAVREALSIFLVSKETSDPLAVFEPAHWKKPAEKAAKKLRNTNGPENKSQ